MIIKQTLSALASAPATERTTSLAFRTRLLPMADRILLHLRRSRSLTCGEVAVILGKTSGQVSRRERFLDQQLRSPVAHQLAAMAAGAPTDLTRLEIEIGFAIHIAGLHARRVCIALNINRPAMRKHLRRINRHLNFQPVLPHID